MKILLARNGPLEGSAYQIGGRMLIGRAGDCDVQLIDKGVSRRHACVLEQEDGSVLLRDLGSSNGTLLGGQPVREVVLEEGAQIEIGDTLFVFREVDAATVQTESLDIKLVSGPAQASTVVERLADVEARALHEELARRRARQTEQAAASGRATPVPCCDSPLAARARQEGWPHCPSCGAAL
jgi:pSer/pThr/pTyr-binding forkhead associated (FHA) protein